MQGGQGLAVAHHRFAGQWMVGLLRKRPKQQPWNNSQAKALSRMRSQALQMRRGRMSAVESAEIGT